MTDKEKIFRNFIRTNHLSEKFDLFVKENSNFNNKFLTNNEIKPDIEQLIKFVINQWSSENEKNHKNHEQLVDDWLKNNCKNWIKLNLS